mmetsp:Transcript_28872/g.47872  ORF Transcript_28872/g.47872 Transcript_28872/m.47872 type:complete len:151 (+) Transcript_28872:527-979(+)
MKPCSAPPGTGQTVLTLPTASPALIELTMPHVPPSAPHGFLSPAQHMREKSMQPMCLGSAEPSVNSDVGVALLREAMGRAHVELIVELAPHALFGHGTVGGVEVLNGVLQEHLSSPTSECSASLSSISFCTLQRRFKKSPRRGARPARSG